MTDNPIFDDYQPLAAEAYDGNIQKVAKPDTGDMADAWWTGMSRNDIYGMWSEPRMTNTDGKDTMDRTFKVQIKFKPTHFLHISAGQR